MSGSKTKFRTNQEEFFEPLEPQTSETVSPGGNGKFIAVIGLSILIAASLATVISIL